MAFDTKIIFLYLFSYLYILPDKNMFTVGYF